jgi:aspartate racemase
VANKFRVGIVGGMGPMAGVHLQKLIIENTKALKDQDHVQVVCFTNPQIPDRTKSLKENNGNKFSKEIINSIKILEAAGADRILIPCNTAHTRFKKIQNSVSIPMVNMVDLVFEKLQRLNVSKAGLLATDGTIASEIFENDNFELIIPGLQSQKEVTQIIYEIKSGKYQDQKIALKINNQIKNLTKNGAEAVILGCTELSIYFSLLNQKNIIDPLTLLAQKSVSQLF